jgi:hypothetical protein
VVGLRFANQACERTGSSAVEFRCFFLIRALHLHPERGSQEPVAPLDRSTNRPDTGFGTFPQKETKATKVMPLEFFVAFVSFCGEIGRGR